MSGIFNIGVSAIQAAQIGIATTGHNISNVNTPGYNRQRAIQEPNIAVMTGSGFIGQGVHVSTVSRMYDSFLEKQVNSAQTSVSELQSYASGIGNINGMLSDVNAGLSPAIQSFFTALQQATSDPTSTTGRQSMVSAAQALTARFRTLEERLAQQYQGVNNQVSSYVSEINSFTSQIAELNQRIIVAESSTQQTPNDLYDQRDYAVSELNKLVKVSVNVNSNGTYGVFIGNGQQLVTDTIVTEMVAMSSSIDSSKTTVGLKSANGVQELPESIVTGGMLGGILNFRSEFLDRTSNDLGRIAASLALTFNAQHALGQDLNGKIQGDAGFVSDFFTISAPKVIASNANPPGSPTVSIAYSPPDYSGNFYTNLTNSDYRLEYDGANVRLTRLTDNVVWTAAGNDPSALNAVMAASTQGPQGFTIDPAAFTAAGTAYTLQPTREAARNLNVNPTMSADVTQLALAAPIRASSSSTNTGNAAISAGSVVNGYTSPASGAPVTLTFNGGNISGFPSFPVTVTVNGATTSYAADPVPYTNGATISFNGINFEISGSPQNGDTFVIEKNVNGVSDNRNAMLLGQLQTQSTMAGQKASYQGIYAQLVSDAGSKGREVQVTLDAYQSLLQQSQDDRNALSGVNLDEEAANLLRYQQAYQAAAKMLDIGTRVFESILALG